MDADRIRQAVETHGCAMLQDDGKAEHQADMPDCEVCLVDAAARAYADLLDGPTDEDIRAGGARLCTPDAHVWNPLPEGFDPPCISHFIEARAVLEAVWQARRNKCS